MDLPRARSVAPLLRVSEAVGSTNAELAAAERVAAQPHGTALAALHQTAGRGRLGRDWVAPPGAAVAVSIVLRPGPRAEALSWLPIVGGLAARDAVAAELPRAAVSLKWPNDVLVGERKIAGVLAELVVETGAVILGIGVNTAMASDELPVPTATSIAVEGGDVADAEALADRVVARVLSGVLDRAARSDGVPAEAVERCGTIGRAVRVELPGRGIRRGVATGLDATGALLVRDEDGSITAVRAGDVTHLRYEGSMAADDRRRRAAPE